MTTSLHRILFPTDFSGPAGQARQYALMFSETFGAELHVLHVIPEVILPATDSLWTVPEGSVKTQVEAAERRLNLEFPNAAARQVTVGFPVEEIIRYASEHAIDLIVAGTHGHTGLTHLLLGSVAEKLVRLSHCPVLTVHPADPGASTGAPSASGNGA